MIIYKDKEAKEFIFRSLNKIIKPVISTLGPYGSSVLLSNNGNPLLTKDGLTVANVIGRNSENPIILNYLANLKEMESNAGDGTTTTSLMVLTLYNAFFSMLYEEKKSKSIVFRKHLLVEALDKFKDVVLHNLSTKIINSDDPTLLRSLVNTIINDNKPLTELIINHFSSFNNEGKLHFRQGEDYKYYKEEGFAFSKESCVIQYNSLTSKQDSYKVLLTYKFDNSLISKTEPVIIISGTELTSMQKKVLEINKEIQALILYLPQVYHNTIKKIIDYDEFTKEGILKEVKSIDNLGVFFSTEDDIDTIKELEEELDKPYYHYILDIPEKDELIFKDIMFKFEDCIKALQKNTVENTPMVIGAGETYKRIYQDLIKTIEPKTIEEDLAYKCILEALLAPSDIIQDYPITEKVYDTYTTSKACIEYAIETFKSLVLINYIVLENE